MTVHDVALVDTSIIAAVKLYDDQGAARLDGQICAAVRAAGRQPGSRAADLMIAATAGSNALALYTANPDDFKGAEGIVEVVGIRGRPNNL